MLLLNRLIKMDKRISIIIPVYNVEQYITDCLESVRKQTYSNLEVILVDDCGPDDSIVLAQKFISRYHLQKSWKIVRHVCNQGPSAARNTGIRESSCEYIYFLDADDIIAPDCIENLAGHCDEETDIVIGRFNYLQDGEIIPLSCSYKEGYYSQRQLVDMYISNEIMWSPCQRLIRRRIVVEHNIFFPVGITASEDQMWNFELLFWVSKVYLSESALYFYVRHENSIVSDARKSVRNQEDQIKVMEMLWPKCNSYVGPNSDSMKRYFNALRYKFIPGMFCWAIRGTGLAFKMLKKNYNPHVEAFPEVMSMKQKFFYFLPASIKAGLNLLAYRVKELTELMTYEISKVFGRKTAKE